jgi:hypothetical protein
VPVRLAAIQFLKTSFGRSSRIPRLGFRRLKPRNEVPAGRIRYSQSAMLKISQSMIA